MSGSCHARFLVVYDFSCPARVSLIPARFRLGVLFQLGSLPLCPVLLVFGQCYARVMLKCLAEFMLPFGQTFSYGFSCSTMYKVLGAQISNETGKDPQE